MQRKKLSAQESEPAMIRAAVVAVVGLLATAGVAWAAELDKDTIGAVVTVLVVVVPLVQGWWTRRAVTANRKVIGRVTSDGLVVAGDASTVPTGVALAASGFDTDGALVLAPVPVDPALVAPAAGG